MYDKYIYPLLLTGSVLSSAAVMAASYDLGNASDSIIGEVRSTRAVYADTLLTIAQAEGLGYREIRLSNPGVDPLLPGQGTEVVLPTQFLLPHAPRQGIVLNIPELRLYFYPPMAPGKPPKVITYPIGIGKEGWNTPYVKTRISQKQKDPSWYPPESIRREHAAYGEILPVRVGPGPENPLGQYAMRLSLGSYLIHGTNHRGGVGMRASHGCIRLYPEDIEALFAIVPVGTPVNIINQPYKVAVHQDRIYLEAHPSLEEEDHLYKDNLTSVVRALIDITEGRNYEIDWSLAKQTVSELEGVPVAIGRINTPETPVADVSLSDPAALQLKLDTSLRRAGQ